jgi:hypothetical protein
MIKHVATETLWGGLLWAVKDIAYISLAMVLFYLLTFSEMCPGG